KNPFFSHLPRWKLTQKLKAFLSDEARAEIGSYSGSRELAAALPDYYPNMNPFNQAEYLEAVLLLPGYILSSQGDRVAMAHAVEGRYPFLDYRVVEFAANLPPALKMKVLNEKHLLRRAAAGLIPESVQRRYKQPYRAPDGCSFFGSKASCVDDMLSPEHIKRNGIFDSKAVTQLVRKFRSGTETSAADNMALVGVLSTEILLDHFVDWRSRPSKEIALS